MRSTASSLSLLLLILATLTTLISARQEPTSYCKCICFQNSTIIPLNAPPTTSPSSVPRHIQGPFNPLTPRADETADSPKHHRLTCNDCNRAFCLDYNLPICKNAREEDVFAQCFQRDSLKDETVVVLFILVTTGLLGWALIKPYVTKMGGSGSEWREGRYMPVNNGGLRTELPFVNGGASSNEPGGSRRSRTREAGASISRQGGLNS